MKQQILDALKARFSGVSDAILSRIADKLAKTTTTAEQVATAVEGVTFQQVLESYGDSRATEASTTAVKNYETKYNLKDGKAGEVGVPPAAGGAGQQTTPPAGGESVPSWAQAILDSNKAMADRLNKMETEKTTNNRRQQLNAIVEKLPENLRKAYQRTSVETLNDEEFNSLITEVGTEVESIASDINAKGAVFGRPANQGGATNSKGQLTEEQMKVISSREATPTEGQPF